MYRAAMRAITVTSTLAGLLLFAPSAEAGKRSFVTLRDDGTMSAKKLSSPDEITSSIMTAYDKSGAKRPDVISLWTTFTMDGSPIETLFDPLSNDVKGIGLETAYKTDDGTGVFPSDYAPTRSILLHNDVTAIEARAKAQNAPVDGLARYLFLLELSHNWGPAVRLPADDAGTKPDALIGFDFHWSFWMDAGGSAAGGNIWKDNGNGTFTTSGGSPKTIKYSMLDLYLMGLADPSEVPPFGLLENAVPPPDVKDPFGKGPYSAKSFPWFGDQPFTATATRRTITIEEIIAANGARLPAKSSGALNLGIVLMVKATATDAEVAKLEEAFEPVAASLAPAFHEATHERGTFTNVTSKDVEVLPDAGAEPDAGVDTPPPVAAAAPEGSSGGCGVAPSAPGSIALAGLIAAGFLVRRRRAARLPTR
jgi:uncharacterized protein (TIGR03382 family)